MSFPVTIWSGLWLGKHRGNMGMAVWTYGWLVSHQTKEKNGYGLVLGGKPLNLKEIAQALGISERTVSRDLSNLDSHGYITRTVNPCGVSIYISKAKKFNWKKDKGGVPPPTKVASTIKIVKIVNSKDNIPSESDFLKLWERYPRKEGKKLALKYFLDSVHTVADLKKITTALDNYIKWNDLDNEGRDDAEKMKYTKMGKTWFGNWQDEKWQSPPESTEQEFING